VRGTCLLLVLACAVSLLVIACTGVIGLTDVPNAGASGGDAAQASDGSIDGGDVDADSAVEGGASTLSIAPASFTFPTTKAGAKSPTQTFTVTNRAGATSAALSTTVSSSSPGSPFAITKDGCSGKSLGAMMSCEITVQFDPITYGTAAALLSINGGQASAALTGTGEDSVQLSVLKSGTGTGVVTDSTGAIACGPTCTASFDRTTSSPVVTLSASPGTRSAFAGWSGGGCSGTAPCIVTLNAASTSVTAQFIPTPEMLTVNFRPIGAGAAGGSISSSPSGISCTGPCTTSATFPIGTMVTLTVSGVSAGALASWMPASCSGSACSITMSSAQTVGYVATGNNIVFVTSAIHDGNLGGLAGAGALCQAAAASGGLPGHYVPWLATSTMKATAALGSARGWIRPDGLPFADTIGVTGGTTGLVNGQIYYPPAIDEQRALVGMRLAWGGGQDGSAASGSTCSDWTTNSAAAPSIEGDPSSGSGMWSLGYTAFCNEALSLYCFGTDLSAPVTVAAPTGRRAFISTGNFDPSSGLPSADSLCQSEAAGAALPNASHFLALLATSSASPASRFNLGGANWQRPDGVAMATSVSALISGNILAAITQHADGSYIEQEGVVWTGATSKDLTVSGTPVSTCADWTSSAAVDAGPYPVVGSSDQAKSDWFNGGGYYCNVSWPVYCFEN